MILIKGFLRHKSSKIYTVIFTFMLLTISVIFGVFQHYSNLITNAYQENSYFLVISKENIWEKIVANNYVANIEKVVLLEPKVNFLFNTEQINESILVDQGNDYILAISNQKREVKLEKNQIAIEFPRFVLQNRTEAFFLEEEQAYIKVKDERKNMEIIKTNESNFARVIVSYEIFQYLESNSDYYAYTFTLNDYSQKEKIVNYFERQENIKIDFIQFYEGKAQLDTIEALEKTIGLLLYGCIVIIVIFLILFIIITYNIIHDEIERMYIEKLLGYNKQQIKKYIIMKIVTLNLIVVFCYVISYICIKAIIINFFNIM